MAISRDDPRTVTVQIMDDLRARIAAGEYPPGGRLPSIRSLASEYGVAGATAQEALRGLQREGVVASVGTRGHFVRDSDTGWYPQPEVDFGDEIDRLRSQVTELRTLFDQIERRVTAIEGDA